MDFCRYMYAFVLLLVAFTVLPVYGETFTFRETLGSGRCGPHSPVPRIKLECSSPQDLVHITSLELSAVPTCVDLNEDDACRLKDYSYRVFQQICEGRRGSCEFDPSNQTDCDSMINRISISFKCFNEGLVHPICNTNPSEFEVSSPLILATPNFVLPNNVSSYEENTLCSCHLTSSDSLKVEMLYAHIEESSSKVICDYDLLLITNGIGNSDEYCGYIGLKRLERLMAIEHNHTGTIYFKSDLSLTERGTWIQVTTDLAAPISLTCVAIGSYTTSESSWITSTPYMSTGPFSVPPTSPNANECLVDNGGCEQICNYTGTRVSCSCRDGYSLEESTRCVEMLTTTITVTSTTTVKWYESMAFIVGMLAAGAGLIILVAVIIAVTCCCLKSRGKKQKQGMRGYSYRDPDAATKPVVSTKPELLSNSGISSTSVKHEDVEMVVQTEPIYSELNEDKTEEVNIQNAGQQAVRRNMNEPLPTTPGAEAKATAHLPESEGYLIPTSSTSAASTKRADARSSRGSVYYSSADKALYYVDVIDKTEGYEAAIPRSQRDDTHIYNPREENFQEPTDSNKREKADKQDGYETPIPPSMQNDAHLYTAGKDNSYETTQEVTTDSHQYSKLDSESKPAEESKNQTNYELDACEGPESLGNYYEQPQ